MSTDSFEVQYKRIIRESQLLFLQDSRHRFEAMNGAVARWRTGECSSKELLEMIYQHVHAMKGVALTLYFDTFHIICEELLSRLKGGGGCELTAAETLDVLILADKLQAELQGCESKVLPEPI